MLSAVFFQHSAVTHISNANFLPKHFPENVLGNHKMILVHRPDINGVKKKKIKKKMLKDLLALV